MQLASLNDSAVVSWSACKGRCLLISADRKRDALAHVCSSEVSSSDESLSPETCVVVVSLCCP